MAYESALDILENGPNNETIVQNMIKAYTIINKDEYEIVVCSVSGGADSDLMIDIASKCDKNNKIRYIYYDTGIEYHATKEHLDELEKKYNIKIEKLKALKPIPHTCLKIGRPFLSKRVSDYIERLQRYNFKWEDRPFDELYAEYPKCKTALRWWCNNWGDDSQFNINRNKWLKEFMVQNPPTFPITNKCCINAKEMTGDKFVKESGCQLQMIGVRKSEGGTRATAYKNCFSQYSDKADQYRPLYFYSDKDKEEYEKFFNITHSKCYTEYGLRRTGCCGCPYGKNFEEELAVLEKYEPKLYKAVQNIFGPSYEYTRAYRKFQAEHQAAEKEKKKKQSASS